MTGTMTERLIIRDLAPADVEAVVEIAVAAWEPIFASFREIFGEDLFALACPNWQEAKARQVRTACEAPEQANVCVAELDGRVVGFATCYAKGSGVGEIGNNAVHPGFQHRGIAQRLYARAFERLEALGMRFVEVSTGGDPSHAPARRAYEKAGFEIRLPKVTYYRKL